MQKPFEKTLEQSTHNGAAFFQNVPQTKSHVVHMTQYYAHDFNDSTSPTYVSTYDITSCVVILLKNINEKKCSSFGMAHVNLANVYFKDKGKENLMEFISGFESIGGQLKTASIQLLGGQRIDSNQVREKIIDLINEISIEKGLGKLTIKVPDAYKLDVNVDSHRNGNSQVMTISCDQNGTYIRKVTFTGGKKTACDLYPEKCTLLSDQNLKNIVPVDRDEHERSKLKTNEFQVEITKLLKSGINELSQEYQNKKQEIKELYCTFEQSRFLSNVTNLSMIQFN